MEGFLSKISYIMIGIFVFLMAALGVIYYKTDYLKKFFESNEPAVSQNQGKIDSNNEIAPETDKNAKYNLVYGENKDGKLRLDLYLPAGKPIGKRPLIFYVHGGGWTEGDKRSVESVRWIEKMVENGYAVASVNYRLAPKGNFNDQIDDLKSALKFLAAKSDEYQIDAQKMGIFGASSGGHLASYLALTYKKDETLKSTVKIRAAINLWGPTNLVDDNFSDDIRDRLGKLLGDNIKAEDASPINFVAKDAPPFLLIHGDKDRIIPFAQSEKFVEALDKSGGQASLLTILNGVHDFASSANHVRPTEFTVKKKINAFFDKYVK